MKLPVHNELDKDEIRQQLGSEAARAGKLLNGTATRFPKETPEVEALLKVLGPTSVQPGPGMGLRAPTFPATPGGPPQVGR